MNAKLVKCVSVLMMASVLVIGSVILLSTPRSIVAESPTRPQTLPPPFLSDANAADAPYGGTPTIDGRINPGEYAGAHQLTFPTYGGNMEVFIRQNAITLYIALDSPDTTPFPFNSGGGLGPAFQVFLDTKHNGGTLPLPDDYRLTVRKDGSLAEHRGSGAGWNPAINISWTAKIYTATYGWQAEYAIDLTKAGITQTGSISIGLAVAEVWTPSWPHDWYWPSSAFYLDPSTWGHLGSSSYWSTFYWKPGPWDDYAPSGVPDFDQRQSTWISGGVATHCGPVAAANSLWWFDSKFETPDHQPPAISDTYRMITPYGAWDDHMISNVVPLVNDLATYFGTNQGLTGTSVISMFYGVNNYLRAHQLWDNYRVTLVPSPTYQWVADEVLRSEDVILLLGFYELVSDPGGDVRWARVGGHYVTVAGVEPKARWVAFSDPNVDWQEINPAAILPGRVLSGTLIPHQPIGPHPPTVHNDAGNVSHDLYATAPTNSPGGVWGPIDYEWQMFVPLFGANPHPTIATEPFHGGPLVQVEVEFALAVSPFDWKASGFSDYAPNGVPDIDQKQDGWVSPIGPGGPQWSFCGPVAAANSLWWFDSKFESSPIAPPTINDHYPLLTPYGPWDDHAPLNVDNPATPWTWPPMPPFNGELVEDLAVRFGTDMIGSGTIIINMFTGIDQYVTSHGLRQGYVITMVNSPDFWWVAEEVERSEDVILLLGFYASTGPVPERVGGHYVTVPGIDKKNGLIAFSDPYWDRAETTWPYANVTGPIFTMGRVANGSIFGHIPIPGHPITTHNDAGNISHDVYPAIPSFTPGGSWGPLGYVQLTNDVTNFMGMNGGGMNFPPGFPASTEVEGAIAVSPVADVWIDKIARPITVTHGDRITFTLTFSNAGSLPAKDVMITDTLPAPLINPTWGASIPITLITGTPYAWRVPDLAWNEGGVITISGQISAANPRLLVTNTATIATSSVEQYQLPSLPNRSSAPFVIVNPNIDMTPTTISITLADGVIATRPLTVANTGSFTLTWNLAEVPAVTWLSETPINGSASPGGNTPITATFNTTGLSNGTYTTALSFTSNDPDQPQVDVPITLTVPPPDIDVTPTSIAITLTEGLTATRSITVANLGQSTLVWNVSEVPTATWLSEAPINGNVPAGNKMPITITFNSTGLAGGIYATTLRFTSNDPDEPQVDTPITLTVIAPHIEVTPVSLAITLTVNLSATQLITVANSGSATLAWSLAEDPAVTWLSETPVGGSLLPGSSATITSTFNITGLVSGIYTTTVRFNSNDPAYPQVDMPITLTIPRRYVYLPIVMKDY